MPTYELEVWVSDTTYPPTLCVVIRDANSRDTQWRVFEPSDRERISFASDDYEQVRQWLSEDEFVLVTGRMQFPEL